MGMRESLSEGAPQRKKKVAKRQAATSSRAPRACLPAYKAQLATLSDEVPVSDEWLHELKYDGYRIAALIDERGIHLESRNGKDWTSAFPELVAALADLPLRSALFDGEVTLVDAEGRTSFQALQNAFSGGARAGLTYFVFDLLYLDGEDLRALPLEQRKARLEPLLEGHATVRYSDHVVGDGPRVLAGACKVGAEGIVSKRRDLPYHPGRNEDWLKIKCSLRQELVVCGFTEPSGARVGVGALLLGYYEGERLVFAGKVGTGKGFTAAYLAQLRKDLHRLEQASSPFSMRLPARFLAGVHWLKPELVAEVSFSEWTNDGRLRHPSWLGLRKDKRAKDVVREKPRNRRAKSGRHG
jgi:bifunctional non-homologous end joining protein LigD